MSVMPIVVSGWSMILVKTSVNTRASKAAEYDPGGCGYNTASYNGVAACTKDAKVPILQQRNCHNISIPIDYSHRVADVFAYLYSLCA